MAPIRVGLIGLSSGTGEITASPGDGWAASAHLPYLISSPHYKIVALCNSSIESAKISVAKFKLPSTTKTYGSTDDLANDPDVDLVVCSVRVDRHYKLMKASLEKGKNAFVEWPLGANLQQAEEMAAIAEKSGSKTVVGLQGRMSPQVQKVKQLVEQGKIGKLISSNVVADVGGMGGPREPPGVDYMAKKAVGGNLLTILYGHMVDNALYALGEFQDFSAVLATAYPKTQLVNHDGSLGVTIDRETPDQIMVQGTIAGSGAPLSITLRGGTSFPGLPSLVWRIYGTEGEIVVTSPKNILGISTGAERVQLFIHDTEKVEEIDCPFPDSVKDLPGPFARCIGLDYEAFATGNTVGLVTFNDAVLRHKHIDEIWKSAAEKTSKSYI